MKDEEDDMAHNDFIFILKNHDDLDLKGLVMTMRFDGTKYSLQEWVRNKQDHHLSYDQFVHLEKFFQFMDEYQYVTEREEKSEQEHKELVASDYLKYK